MATNGRSSELVLVVLPLNFGEPVVNLLELELFVAIHIQLCKLCVGCSNACKTMLSDHRISTRIGYAA